MIRGLGSEFVNFRPPWTLGSPVLPPTAPTRRTHSLPSRLAPPARTRSGVRRWRVQSTPTFFSPPRGRRLAAFIPPLPSRLLAFPLLSPSTARSCRRRRTLCCGTAGAAAVGPGDWRRDPSWRLDRELPFSSVPHLLSSLAALRSGPQPPVFTVALWRHRGGGSSFSSVPPSPPSLIPSLPTAPPRRSSPSPPKSS